jgi:hypothetical protein
MFLFTMGRDGGKGGQRFCQQAGSCGHCQPSLFRQIRYLAYYCARQKQMSENFLISN